MFDAGYDLEDIIAALTDEGIGLTDEELSQIKEILQECRDPKKALQIINQRLEKLRNKRLEKEKLEIIRNRRKLEFLANATAEKIRIISKNISKKNSSKTLNDAEITSLLRKAEEVLGTELTEKQRKNAKVHFKRISNPLNSPEMQANAVLLSVMLSTIAASIAVVVRFAWGNLINVPDVKPSIGNASIDLMKKSFEGKVSNPSEAYLRTLYNLSNGILDADNVEKYNAYIENCVKNFRIKKSQNTQGQKIAEHPQEVIKQEQANSLPTPKPYKTPNDPYAN